MGVQGGMLNTLRVVWYGAPTHPRVGATLPMLDRRPPTSLVGIPQSSDCWQPPHSRPLNLCCVVDVLVSPTGNGVLNQIPVGDSRESSREQVMPADGALFFTGTSSWGAGRSISPHQSSSGDQWQSDLPDPQKKKKKKKKVERSRGRGGVEVEVEITHGQ